MRKIIVSVFLFMIPGIFIAFTSHGAERTLVFQQGSGGYQGVKDTWISTNEWATPPQNTINYGQNHVLLLFRDHNPVSYRAQIH